MSDNTENAFDDILTKIAGKILREIVVEKLGKNLGFGVPDIVRFNKENAGETKYVGTLKMLREWLEDQKVTDLEAKKILKAALEKSGLHRLAENCLSDDVGTKISLGKTTPPQGASAAAGEVFTSKAREVTKKQIVKLSKLLPDGKYSELCGILGFEYSYITKIKKKHVMDSTAAFEELLHEWNDKGGSIEDLDAALKEADLGGLAPKYKN